MPLQGVMKAIIALGWLVGSSIGWCAAAESVGPYEVKPGDSLSEIAVRHHTTVAVLKRLNKLDSDLIRVGQKLKLREGPAAKATRHHVQPGETLWRIGRRHGVTPEELMRINGLSSPQELRAGSWLKLRADGTTVASTSSSTPEPTVNGRRIPDPVTAAAEGAGSERSAKGVDRAGQAVSFRTLTLEKAETIGSLARRHGMTVQQLNAVNGWNFESGTWLAAGSEVHVLNAAVH